MRKIFSITLPRDISALDQGKLSLLNLLLRSDTAAINGERIRYIDSTVYYTFLHPEFRRIIINPSPRLIQVIAITGTKEKVQIHLNPA